MLRGDQVVQGLPWRWGVQGKIFVIGGLGFAFDAWDVALTGVMLPLLTKDFGLSGLEQGLFAASSLAGMAVGAFSWGTVGDVLGRKRAFTVTLLIFALVTLVGAASPTFWFLLVTRFLAASASAGACPWTTPWSPSSRPARCADACSPGWTCGGRSAPPAAG